MFYLTKSAGLCPCAAPSAADKPKPTLSLKASPPTGFAPTRVVLTAELKGGVNDYEEFYCPSIEWVWGDDTKAESKVDCEPYEAGKSSIPRRFSADHTFRLSGDYRLTLRVKQKEKVISSITTTVTVRPSAAEGFE